MKLGVIKISGSRSMQKQLTQLLTLASLPRGRPLPKQRNQRGEKDRDDVTLLNL